MTLTSDSHHEHHEHNNNVQKKNIDDGLDAWQLSNDEEVKVTLTSDSKHMGGIPPITLAQVIEGLDNFELHPPIEIHPPRGDNGVWTVRSMTPNRPLRSTHHFDRWSGKKVMSIEFTDYHPVKRLASYGIAFHEGALFGWLNQVLGLIAALGVIMLSITGFYMWWKRRPKGKLAAPGIPTTKHIPSWVIVTILGFALFLPMFALGLLLILAFELTYSLVTTRAAPIADKTE